MAGIEAASGESADMAASGKRLLGEVLVDRRHLTPAQLSEALLQQRVSGKRLGALLVELGALDERDLADALGEHFGVPVVDLRHTPADEDAIARLVESTARSLERTAAAHRRRRARDRGRRPERRPQRLSSPARSAMPVRLVVAAASDIKRAIDSSYRALAAIGVHIKLSKRPVCRCAGLTARPRRQAATDSAPVVQVVKLLMTQALRDRASDVHVEPMGETVRVRFRIDGVLARRRGAARRDGQRRRQPHQSHGRHEHRRAQAAAGRPDRDERSRAAIIDIRVASTGTVGGEKIVMRILDKSKPLFRLSDLGMPDATAATYSTLGALALRHGRSAPARPAAERPPASMRP